jgi:integrase
MLSSYDADSWWGQARYALVYTRTPSVYSRSPFRVGEPEPAKTGIRHIGCPHRLRTGITHLASIQKHTRGWRAQVARRGIRSSAVFKTKAEAELWAAREESAILSAERGMHPRKTLGDALDRYVRDVSVTKPGARFEELRLAAFKRDFPALTGKLLGDVKTPEIAGWRDARLKTVKPASVQREINLLRNVFAVARDEWHWCSHSPFKGLRMPGESQPRDRRISPSEVRRIVRWLGYSPIHPIRRKQQEVALAFLIALRTAMREGEIAGLTAEAVDLDRRVVRLGTHKTVRDVGVRHVPLTYHGARLLRRLGNGLTVSADSISTLFARAVRSLMIEDLHFHDSRREALTRLARKVDVMTLARISGHKDISLLYRVYYGETAEDIARRL